MEFDECNSLTALPIEFGDLSPYDVRIKCEKRPLCYDLDYVGDYLNSAVSSPNLVSAASGALAAAQCNCVTLEPSLPGCTKRLQLTHIRIKHALRK